MGDLSLAIDLGFPTPVSLDCVVAAGQGDFHTVTVGGAPSGTTTTTTTPATTTTAGATTTTTTGGATTTTAANVQGTQQLAQTGTDSWLIMALVAVVLLDIGYLTLSASRPRRRAQRA
jgi:hypothetical protein